LDILYEAEAIYSHSEISGSHIGNHFLSPDISSLAKPVEKLMGDNTRSADCVSTSAYH
jgi:hypothetical protein